ncbi:MAG: hypothetical protein IJN51_03410 [Alistipes sp.]|nr:hypothetical protein [Alistipes sp.]
MKKILIGLFVLINIQCLSAQDKPAIFSRLLPTPAGWNKYIILYPEGVYMTTASHLGTVISWGEWEQKDSVILFRRYPQAYADKNIEFTLAYDADAEGKTIVTSNIQALVSISANGTSSDTLIFGEDGNSLELPYQADSIGVVWQLSYEHGPQIKSVALYDSKNSRYNNVVRIKLKENDNYAYVGCTHSHVNHLYTIVDDEVLVERGTNFEYVRMDSTSVERYMNRYFFTDELVSTINDHRKSRSVIAHNLPEAKDVYNHSSERFLQKFESNEQRLTDEELIDAVCNMLGTELPDKSVLSTEDEYILLVNYLFCRNEDASEGIWNRLYFQLAEYPEKLYLLTQYIELLPDDIREKAQEQLCHSLADTHYIENGYFDRGTFIHNFWEMAHRWAYSKYIRDIHTRYR